MKNRYMRGYADLTGWIVLIAAGRGKKWEAYTPMKACSAIMVFVSLAAKHAMMPVQFNRAPWPLRLLGPGGVIAAERFVQPRKNNKPKRKLISPGVLRQSIVAPAVARTFFLQDMPSKG